MTTQRQNSVHGVRAGKWLLLVCAGLFAPTAGQGMSLTTALLPASGCTKPIAANSPNRYPACSNSVTNWQSECTDVARKKPDGTLAQLEWGNFPSPNTNVQGYSYYDGPARIDHNRFINFRFDPTGLYPGNLEIDQAARLLTQTDIQNIATSGIQGQLQGLVAQAQAAPHAAPSSNYQGYVGDPANGWQTSNAQTVPPTQYTRDSIWDNVDFKHQVYTEAVNMGPFNDGDKTTVIRDLDSQLSGLRVVDGGGSSDPDVVPISLNSVDYYATDFTVDEPHSRGPNDFRATSLMSPHKYATLNIESVDNPPYGGTGTCTANNPDYIPTCFRVVVQRDMPAYGDSVYPSLFLNGRGQLPIYEPFVMDRMGYMVYGVQGTEHATPPLPPLIPTAFQEQLLFSYTDPGVKKTGKFFVNRIAVYQPVTTPANIKVYRIRRQWGGQVYENSSGNPSYPPNFNPPGGAGNTCDGIFSQNQGCALGLGLRCPTGCSTGYGRLRCAKWDDCLARATNQSPYNVAPYTNPGYPYGITLQPAANWTDFENSYENLLAGRTTVQDFIKSQTYYYDATNNLLYFYMIEDQPVQQQYSPYGTCGGGGTQYAANVATTQTIKSFSDPNSVQAALDASCLVSGGTPQKNDLFVCDEIGCAAYLVDFSNAGITTPATLPSNTPPKPIHRTEYEGWNQYHLVYGTPAQQPNGLPVPATAPRDGTALPNFVAPVAFTPPPTGDYVSYDFLPLSGGPFQVNETFPYHCVMVAPWSPVNPRGAYPPSGGFTYPLHDSACEWLSRHPPPVQTRHLP